MSIDTYALSESELYDYEERMGICMTEGHLSEADAEVIALQQILDRRRADEEWIDADAR